MPAILFVCTANICRSPMAAKIFQKIAAESDSQTKWKVESAGTWAEKGFNSSENAQIVLKTIGLDISTHLSQNVVDVDIEQYDLILTMEAGHKEALLFEFPKIADRIYMLSEMVGSTFDIADPIGRSVDEYQKTAELLEDLMRRGYPRIKELINENN